MPAPSCLRIVFRWQAGNLLVVQTCSPCILYCCLWWGLLTASNLLRTYVFRNEVRVDPAVERMTRKLISAVENRDIRWERGSSKQRQHYTRLGCRQQKHYTRLGCRQQRHYTRLGCRQLRCSRFWTTPRKCALVPCGHLDFKPAVTAHNDEFNWLHVKT